MFSVPSLVLTAPMLSAVGSMGMRMFTAGCHGGWSSESSHLDATLARSKSSRSAETAALLTNYKKPRAARTLDRLRTVQPPSRLMLAHYPGDVDAGARYVPHLDNDLDDPLRNEGEPGLRGRRVPRARRPPRLHRGRGMVRS